MRVTCRRSARPLLAAFALALALVSSLGGCAAAIPHVARGETLATGDALFDDFFVAVRDVRTEALAAQADEEASHARFITALGLTAKTPPSSAVDETGLRAHKLSDKGVLLHLEITPDARLLTVRGKWDPGADGDALFKAVEEAAKSSLDMRRRLATVALHAAELERRRVALRTQASATFRDASQSKRDEIVLELDAAQPVLADAGERASNAAGAAARFVVELTQAVETGAVAALENGKLAKGGKKPAPQPAPSPPVIVAAAASPKPAPAPAKPVAAPARPAAPSAGAPAPAKKKPKGVDDFEP